MRRVLYRTTGQDDWFDIVKELEDRYEWTPTYWLDPGFIEDDIVKVFPNVTYQKCKYANIIGLPDDTGFRYRPLDADILDTYQKYRPDILRTMDRMDSGNTFSYDERVRHYHRQLRYWLHIFEEHGIDLVVYGLWPHQVSGLLIYSICMENDIEFVHISNPIVPGYLRVDGDPRGVNKRLEEVYLQNGHELNTNAITETSRVYIETLVGEQPSTTTHPMSKNHKYLSRLSNIRNLPRLFSKLNRTDWRGTKPRSMLVEDSQITLAQKILYEKKVDWHKRKLKKSYDRLSVSPDYSSDFIYVPLHYEPEASINPLGENYRNQFNFVDMLSKNAPRGWKLFIKEHPDQFRINKMSQGRQNYDYHDLSALDNVSLVNISTSTYDLIDKAEMTATVTGTAAWESVVRGTPSIVFGHARFRLCEGVFHVTTSDQVEAAIEAIRKMDSVEMEQILRFVRALEIVGYRGYQTDRQKKSVDMTKHENISNTVEALHQFVIGEQ